MQESKEPIEFTEASQPDDELDVQEEVCTLELNVSIPLPVALTHAVRYGPQQVPSPNINTLSGY